MTELYVDPGHRLSDEDFAAVVRRAKEVREELERTAGGGAAGAGGIVVDLTARCVASKKYFPVSGIATQLLVLHSAECPLRTGYAISLTEWFSATVYPAYPTASWQRFVDPVYRVRAVPDYLGAWHASEANPMSIGWEQAGYARFTREEWLTPDGRAQMELLAFDMAEVAVRDGIPARWLTTAEVEAVTHYGNRTIRGFCLHRQIDPDTRTDPGDGYPYEMLMDRIRFYMGGGALANTSTTTEQKEEWEMADVNDVVEAVWSRHVTRVVDGQEVRIPAIQELADAKTYAEQALANTAPIVRDGEEVSLRQEVADSKTMLIAQGALLRELAANQGISSEQVERILREAAREALQSVAVVSRLESVGPVLELEAGGGEEK